MEYLTFRVPILEIERVTQLESSNRSELPTNLKHEQDHSFAEYFLRFTTEDPQIPEHLDNEARRPMGLQLFELPGHNQGGYKQGYCPLGETFPHLTKEKIHCYSLHSLENLLAHLPLLKFARFSLADTISWLRFCLWFQFL